MQQIDFHSGKSFLPVNNFNHYNPETHLSCNPELSHNKRCWFTFFLHKRNAASIKHINRHWISTAYFHIQAVRPRNMAQAVNPLALPQKLISELLRTYKQFKSPLDVINALSHRLDKIKHFQRIDGLKVADDFLIETDSNSMITDIFWVTGYMDGELSLTIQLAGTGIYRSHSWSKLKNINPTSFVRGVLPDLRVEPANSKHLAVRRHRGRFNAAYFDIETIIGVVEHARDMNLEVLRTVHNSKVSWLVPVPVYSAYAAVSVDPKTRCMRVHTLLNHRQVARHEYAGNPQSMKWKGLKVMQGGVA